MAKLTKKEKNKIAMQMCTVDRGATWVGYRPSVYKSKKYNIKSIRRENKKECMNGKFE